MNVKTYIKSDYYRYKGENVSFLRILAYCLIDPPMNYSLWLRLSKSGGLCSFFAKLMHRHFSIKYGVQIPCKTKIGYGLYIGHCIGIVVSCNSVIGNNVNLSHFVSLGGVNGKAPTIGDNVYIGPNVSVIGGVKIGNNVTIGAGAVVTKDIPDNVTVAGVPAKVIQNKCHPEYVQNRYNTIDIPH